MTVRSHTISAQDTDLSIDVERRGAVTDSDVSHLLDHVKRVIRPITSRLLDAHALMTVRHDRDPGAQARVRVTLRAKGETIRAEAYAATIGEATANVETRLRRQIDQRTRRARNDPRGRDHEVGEWRHGNRRSQRTNRFHRAPEEREIVVHKSPAAPHATVEEAQWDRFLLDYDFFLFVEAETGRDRLLVAGDDETPEQILDIDDAPTLQLSGAREWLDQTADDHHFFVDEATGRGAVIYRRYDGHYGLITLEERA